MVAITKWHLSKLATGLGLVNLVLSAVLDVPALAVVGLALVALGWATARIWGPVSGAYGSGLPLVEKTPTLGTELRSLGSAAVFTLVAFFFLRSWEEAWVVMVSLAVHELGHLLAARAMGVPAVLGFSIMGAWTWTPLRQRAAISQSANTLIHLAGPIASLAYALLALCLHLWLGGGETGDYWLRLANLNALLCLVNILPMGDLSDGGKTVRRLFGSVSRRVRQELLLLFILLPVILGWALINLPLWPMHVVVLVTVVLWVGVALLRQNRAASRSAHQAHKTMSGRQARLLLVASLVLLVASLVTVLATPFWLTEQHALGIAYGLGSLVVFVGWEGPLALRLSVGIATLLLVLVAARAGWQLRQEGEGALTNRSGEGA